MPSVTGQGDSFGGAMRSVLSQVSLGRARPSYQARSAAARFRQLNRTEAGRRALSLAGVEPSARTARRWATRQQAPSRRNEAAIARAYLGMRRGGVPDWVKSGRMEITGRVAYGPDVRERGADGNAPLRVEMQGAPLSWPTIEGEIDDLDDDELGELIAEEIIEEDIGSGYPWGFPGGSYSVTVSG